MTDQLRINLSFDEYYLNNGLRVILHQDQRVPIVAVNLWYRVGSKHETEGKTGFAHLFEHMMFQGSQHVGADMHFQWIQSVGGTLNGSTFFDRTNYFETLPSHYLELGLWLESDRMGYLLPAMTREKLDKQRDVVKNERRQRIDNRPYGLWLEYLLELAYPEDFPYHWPIIGYMEDLDQATLEDIEDFFRTYYAPNNASLVLAGDFEKGQARELLEKYFGPLPAGPPVPPKVLTKNFYHSGEKSRVVRDAVQLPRLYLAYHLPGVGAPEFFALDLLTDLFSQGKSGRLYQELVYKSQIAQDAQAFILPMQEASLLIFVATARPDTDRHLLQSRVEALISEWQNHPVKAEELLRVKNQVEARKIRELQAVAGKADTLNMCATYFDDPAFINREIHYYDAVTRQDIMQVAQQFLVPENRVVLQFIPE
jgi:zinc protease